MLASSYNTLLVSRLRAAVSAQLPLLLLLLVSFLGYLGPSHLPLPTAHEVPMTPVDEVMPLLPWTVVGYVMLYPFLLVTILHLALRPSALRPVVYALIAANIIGGIIFVAYRTTVPRPPLPATTWDAQLLRFLWSLDPPYNAFPSLHVAYAVIIAWGFARIRSRWLPPVLLVAAVVIVTTLTTYQHRLLDLIGGGLLALVLGTVYYRRLSPRDDLPHW